MIIRIINPGITILLIFTLPAAYSWDQNNLAMLIVSSSGTKSLNIPHDARFMRFAPLFPPLLIKQRTIGIFFLLVDSHVFGIPGNQGIFK
jgi:hypothetical protein